uniref:Uncharacterized protein n=1 Tax=Meloidogyne enterolobii TaxID=390850 RepID=A0A6V7Y175_MELEN|nr:unnamed protein product [Meloidogyne enterolobii]
MGIDSIASCWTRGVIRVPCRGRGTIRVVQEKFALLSTPIE